MLRPPPAAAPRGASASSSAASFALLLLLLLLSASYPARAFRVGSAPRRASVTSPAPPRLPTSRYSGVSERDSTVHTNSDCDDVNTPPSLSYLISSLKSLKSGSDIRGQYVDHNRVGSVSALSHLLRDREPGSPAALTPFAAHCLGAAFAHLVKVRCGKRDVTICVGRDPRMHGVRLADSVCRGAEDVEGVRAVYTGLATTPSMFEFCRADMCDGGVMVTASHLPEDRNGCKFFSKTGGLTGDDIDSLIDGAVAQARRWHDMGLLPPGSGDGGVLCSEWVDYMPHYSATLRESIINEICAGIQDCDVSTIPLPLAGLRIVLNAGNGSGYFFNDILQSMGADVSSSLGLVPDGTFPRGVPNPERQSMIDETREACEECNADLGVLLDTDADRAGFVVPRTVRPDKSSDYEALNRNRLIALLGVVLSNSSPGCTVVTDSVTSEGLATFLEDDLGLKHVRYLKGYANVIGKAREITESGEANAEMAIETSGHCAMRENGYLDDGTYAAVKVIGLLARVSRARPEDGGGGHMSLLDLISDLTEMPEESELRMSVLDGSLDTMACIFDRIADKVEGACETNPGWTLDLENLEGVRVRTGGGGFFMVRKSLHDPLISLQVEGESREEVRTKVVMPILDMFEGDDEIDDAMDLRVLQDY